jgi:hypothetical protein
LNKEQEKRCATGLPDGLFSNQKSQFGKKSRSSDWKMLIYFTAIWNILWTFGIFNDHFVQFVLIWYIFLVLVSCTKKNLATLVHVANLEIGQTEED